MSLDPTGKGRQRWTSRWKAALNAFDITFDGRLSTVTEVKPTKISYTVCLTDPLVQGDDFVQAAVRPNPPGSAWRCPRPSRTAGWGLPVSACTRFRWLPALAPSGEQVIELFQVYLDGVPWWMRASRPETPRGYSGWPIPVFPAGGPE